MHVVCCRSIYDSFSWMEKFGDPKFLYHVEMAHYWGLMTLRLSEPEVRRPPA